MTDKELIKKVADIPLARPGFDALSLSAPVILQINPDGKWKSEKPSNLEEEQLRAVVQHLVNSKAINMDQSFCGECMAENKNTSVGNSNYLPVIMMPIYPAESCPFDMDCEIAKMEDNKAKKAKKSPQKATGENNVDNKANSQKKLKKRGFVMQRLTDFDLLSQW